MKKLIKNKILIAVLVITAFCALLLVACAMPGKGEAKSVEQEVEEALSDQIPDSSDEEYAEGEDTALAYVDVEDPVVEKPDESVMTDAALDNVAVEISAADDLGNTESTVETEDDTLQIVFIGDSIFDAVRDETGIAYRVGASLDADVYNLSIGGTTAGLRTDKNTKKEEWNEPNFLGICYSMNGEVPESLLAGYKAGEIMKTCDFSKTDYFIIDYGTNDFLWYIPLGTDDYRGNYYFYFRSAYDLGIEYLHDKYPNAKFILCTPYYEEFWSADRSRYIGDTHSVNNGYGTLLDYISVVRDVANDHHLTCLDMYDLMGIDIYNINDMTVDGIHPSEAAREKYANLLIDEIRLIEENPDNYGKIRRAEETETDADAGNSDAEGGESGEQSSDENSEETSEQ